MDLRRRWRGIMDSPWMHSVRRLYAPIEKLDGLLGVWERIPRFVKGALRMAVEFTLAGIALGYLAKALEVGQNNWPFVVIVALIITLVVGLLIEHYIFPAAGGPTGTVVVRKLGLSDSAEGSGEITATGPVLVPEDEKPRRRRAWPLGVGVREIGAATAPITEPKLEVVPETIRQMSPHPHGSGEARVFLRIRSTQQVRQCYGRLAKLVWAMTYVINDDQRISHRRLFADRDIYFRWQGTGQRYHGFHSEAILEIALARYGDGQGGWAAHPDTPVTRPIAFHEDYYLSIEIAGDDTSSQIEHFRLRFYTESERRGNDIYLEPRGTPPHVQFETIDELSIPNTEESQTE